MAHLKAILIATISLIVTTAVATNPAFAGDPSPSAAPAPAPGPSRDLSPIGEDLEYLMSIPPAERKTLDQCSKKMSQKCGNDVVSGMLLKSNVSDDCCGQLIKMGRNCHTHLVRLLVQYPDFKPDAKMIKKNAGKVWSECEDAVDNASPPSS